MTLKQAKAIRVGNIDYVLYPTGKAERCHNRGTANFLANKFNTKAREVKSGISK